MIGVRMALETGEGHSAVPVRSTLAGAIVGIASIVAALTFTTSINHLLDTPRLRGVSWDAVIGDAFDPGDANQVLPVVRHTRAVDQISAGGAGTLTIGGRSITAVGMDRITGNIQPVLLAGHVPLRDDEIVLANRTLRDLHTHIGGVVTASSGSRSARMLVVGTAVAPTLPTVQFKINQWRRAGRIGKEDFTKADLAKAYEWVKTAIGMMVTLRQERMWDFMDKLITAGLPRIRDFRGISPEAFDGRGNYSLGLREQIIFPEVEYDKVDRIRGLQVSIVTTAKTDEEGKKLLELLGMPFAKAA